MNFTVKMIKYNLNLKPLFFIFKYNFSIFIGILNNAMCVSQ